jgi:hypothetical protein
VGRFYEDGQIPALYPLALGSHAYADHLRQYRSTQVKVDLSSFPVASKDTF